MVNLPCFQVRAVRSGNQTAIADILRLVETAQARTAPVQRLADAVAGRFAYAVMGVSAATFAFWATVGTRVFPQVGVGPLLSHPIDTTTTYRQESWVWSHET